MNTSALALFITLFALSHCQSDDKDDLRLHHVVRNASVVRGQVEISGDNQWYPLCAQLWTKKDADIVCRTLGYPEIAIRATNDYSFRPEKGYSYLLPTGLGCLGTEDDVTNCRNWKNGIVISFFCPQGIAVAECENNSSPSHSSILRTYRHYAALVLLGITLHWFSMAFHRA